jgi:hypothetical protein
VGLEKMGLTFEPNQIRIIINIFPIGKKIRLEKNNNNHSHQGVLLPVGNSIRRFQGRNKVDSLSQRKREKKGEVQTWCKTL